MTKRLEINHEMLVAELSYDPATGIFTWNRHKSPNAPAGSIAGTITKFGYRRIRLGQQTWMAHVLAWAYYYGFVPADDIDHINRDRSDNRIENLRTSTRSQNNLNSDRWNRRGKLRGTRLSKYGKWYASISIDGYPKHLGLFETQEEASAAYWKAYAERG